MESRLFVVLIRCEKSITQLLLPSLAGFSQVKYLKLKNHYIVPCEHRTLCEDRALQPRQAQIYLELCRRLTIPIQLRPLLPPVIHCVRRKAIRDAIESRYCHASLFRVDSKEAR